MHNKIKRIFSWPKRYFRSKGFGVHSPFAYAFICDVMREKGYSYYSYSRIAQLAPSSSADRRTLRLVARLISHFSPDCIYASGRLSPHILTVASLIRKGIRSTADPREASFLWIGKGGVYPEERSEWGFDDKPFRVVVMTHRNNEAAKAVSDAMPHGMCFNSSESSVAVVTPRLPRQNFDLL